MNLFLLRLSWLSVKAAELLLPMAWILCKIVFYLLLAALGFLFLVIFL